MAGTPPPQTIPEATVARLPIYLRSLQEFAADENATISSGRLAELAGVNAAKVRKDLSYFGSYGTRGVGYDVRQLVVEIRRELGLTHDWPTAIVGMGNLGRALANYAGFSERGFSIAALLDTSDDKVGTVMGGTKVSHLDDLERLVERHSISIGIIATPAIAAQDVAERMVGAGIESILNFAPTVISVPEGILVRKVDLAVELQILSFYQERRATDAGSAAG
ncbi:MAG TPA: redox-sensing transcriptional repressor Rex [Microthrixaceae bacterium]|nr:redox-sensing transcriptional repressor Rex [Microthrixaceae bacterium]HMT25324.1 redox-sensing transcriptional repressor Rex [Microthrixaceae bacterium]HMT60304.1 redox-sensing transcriptional repressor Rex [Microthrixaceae bacterium]